MVATASSAAADISSQLESVIHHNQFTENNSVGVAVRLGSDGSTGNRSESPTSQPSTEGEHCAPMDLSSGGGATGGVAASQSILAAAAAAAATPTFMMAAAAAAVASNANGPGSTPISAVGIPPTPSLTESLLNARRLAEFVRAQQIKSQAEKEASEAASVTPPKMVPRKRAWPELQLDLSAMVSEKFKKQEDINLIQNRPTSPTESNSSSGGGGSGSPAATPSVNKEVKKRRLDQLLSQKFSVSDSPSPPGSAAESSPFLKHRNGLPQPPLEINLNAQPQPLLMRRDSAEKKLNRRKRASPQNFPGPNTRPSATTSPVTLSLRPNSELLQKPAAMPPKIETKNEDTEEEDTKHSMKNQLLQLHLAQAALLNQTNSGLFPGLPGLPGLPPLPLPGAHAPGAAAAGANPLLYYGYYAQMIQGLQSQQQKLLEQLSGKSAAKNMLSSSLISSPKVQLINVYYFLLSFEAL